jgi:hypothetical protein
MDYEKAPDLDVGVHGYLGMPTDIECLYEGSKMKLWAQIHI